MNNLFFSSLTKTKHDKRKGKQQVNISQNLIILSYIPINHCCSIKNVACLMLMKS
jgi:hypothetical protein